ncbi:MAG: cysteine desulfurase NifS [Clostridia bacterium]|nr:cysteine desulfurase NifS [Clostridia bacterium]
MSMYFDNAGTTAIKPEVMEAVLPYLAGYYGNASSIHAVGRDARKAVENARAQVAAAIHAKPEEIYFTAGGTESDNWAVKGTAFAHCEKGKHIITSAIEHHAVLHSCQWLQKQGFDITYLPVDAHGLVSLADVEAAIRPDTILISIMMANNEIGAIQPVAEIGALAKAHKVLFHTDAVQAVGAVPIDVGALGVDMLSLSGHKIYGVKGVGALYIRQGVRIDSLLHGGAQERGRRAGTENLPAIVGLGAAIELITQDIESHVLRLIKKRDRLIGGILTAIPHTRLNGHPTRRLPGNVNVSVDYIEGEALLLRLDLAGFQASSGSACTSGSLDPSHVLLAIGLSHEAAHGSLRLSVGDFNTEQDVDELLAVLPGIVQSLRDMSPMYQNRS